MLKRTLVLGHVVTLDTYRKQPFSGCFPTLVSFIIPNDNMLSFLHVVKKGCFSTLFHKVDKKNTRLLCKGKYHCLDSAALLTLN